MKKEKMLEMYRMMVLIRRFEERTAQMYGLQKIGGFCHLYIGQEAVAVGAIAALNEDDYFISSYRDHGHIIAKGGDPKGVMAELFGKSGGVSKGKGGSMHIADFSVGMLGANGVVGGGYNIAVGAGMSAHLAGVIAAHTTLPVIAVPIDASSLGGLDALLAMVQMPPGIPVATMGIGKAGAKNAALLALSILSLADAGIREKLDLYRSDLKKAVLEADEGVRKL